MIEEKEITNVVDTRSPHERFLASFVMPDDELALRSAMQEGLERITSKEIDRIQTIPGYVAKIIQHLLPVVESASFQESLRNPAYPRAMWIRRSLSPYIFSAALTVASDPRHASNVDEYFSRIEKLVK
jgi:hypothetical protein